MHGHVLQDRSRGRCRHRQHTVGAFDKAAAQLYRRSPHFIYLQVMICQGSARDVNDGILTPHLMKMDPVGRFIVYLPLGLRQPGKDLLGRCRHSRLQACFLNDLIYILQTPGNTGGMQYLHRYFCSVDGIL